MCQIALIKFRTDIPTFFRSDLGLMGLLRLSADDKSRRKHGKGKMTCIVRPLVKSVYQKNNFLISQPKNIYCGYSKERSQ